MKRMSVIFSALAIVALISTVALARGGMGMGPGSMGPGYAYNTQITPQQQAALQKARADFLKDTQDLRNQIAQKRVELSTLWAQPNPDQARVTALNNQLVDLRAQLLKKRNQYLANFAGSGFGPGFGPGFCPGFGGGFGPHGGYHMMGRGWGMGYGGMGMGMGYSGGPCW